MLHLVSESSLSQVVVERIAAEDDVVLQSGAVWAAFSGHQDNVRVEQLLTRGCNVYVLQDVLSMNGIGDQQLFPGVECIDYSALVELTVKNPVIHTWC